MANPAARMPSTSWMIADLLGIVNNFKQNDKVITYRSVLFPAPASRSTKSSVQGTRWRCKKTYVYHESTKATPASSILLTHCSRRTTLQFRCVELPERTCDLLTGQGERASIERCRTRIAVGHLQDTVGLTNERLGKGNELFILFISRNTWWRVTTNASQHGQYLFRARHLPNSCRILSVDVFPSTKQKFRKIYENNHEKVSYLP